MTKDSSSECNLRRFPIGAETAPDGVHFRVWAPRCSGITVIVDAADHPGSEYVLKREPEGYFSAAVTGCKAGDLYRFRLDGSGLLRPDPASRFQPEGPFGPSMIIDPQRFRWRDHAWNGAALKGQIIYEMHVGTFTLEGTWQAASRQLPELQQTGVTVLEIMPVNDFCGDFGWGYDGVNYFAPTRLYGTPDDFRAFVDQAHRCKLAVILDVVYNHAGPSGNFLKDFSADYFTDRYETEWGEAFNFDGPESAPVRQFFLCNAAYWICEFHLDGLRLDATQALHDASETHILADLVKEVRRAAGARSVLVIGENEPQNSKLLKPVEDGGYGLDALWNDDFHHSAMVASTGRAEAYYCDYRGAPQEFISAAKYGYLYQGQYYRWQKKRRGSSSAGIEPASFVNYLQNHDQVANSGRGWRIQHLTDPGTYRAMTALLLLGPQTPMLFQGQEFAASAPFTYFADHEGELAEQVKKGRGEFLRQFASLASDEMQRRLPDPTDARVFAACKLDFAERDRHRTVYDLHRDLLRLRREDRAFSRQSLAAVDGAVLAPHAFVLRFFAPDGEERLLLVNLGSDYSLDILPEPLLAPPAGAAGWRVLWSSESPLYGGSGAVPVDTGTGWLLVGKSAYVLSGRSA